MIREAVWNLCQGRTSENRSDRKQGAFGLGRLPHTIKVFHRHIQNPEIIVESIVWPGSPGPTPSPVPAGSSPLLPAGFAGTQLPPTEPRTQAGTDHAHTHHTVRDGGWYPSLLNIPFLTGSSDHLWATGTKLKSLRKCPPGHRRKQH